MHIGVGLPNTVAGLNGAQINAWLRQIDQGPFSSAAVLDRLVYDSYEPMTTLAAGAALTTRIRLATMIVIGPLRNSAILAKMAATINALSGGRFSLGVALGARVDDYQAAGVSLQGRGELFTRQLAALREQWDAADLGPHAVGRPELLVGGLTDVTFSRVARYADGYMHNGGPPQIFARMAERALSAWTEAGRPARPRLWGMGYFSLGDEAAAEAGRAYLRDYYAFTGPFAERIAQGLLTTPQAITQYMRGYAEAGCDELVLFPVSGDLEHLDKLAHVVG